jgi:hypothetical protein
MQEKRENLSNNCNMEEALSIYLILLEQGQYFDAHEVLEEAWHPLRKSNHPLKNLVKGFINGAIAFEHIKRDQSDAQRKATTVYKSFEKHKHLLVEGIEHYALFKIACDKVEYLHKTNKIYESLP